MDHGSIYYNNKYNEIVLITLENGQFELSVEKYSTFGGDTELREIVFENFIDNDYELIGYL